MARTERRYEVEIEGMLSQGPGVARGFALVTLGGDHVRRLWGGANHVPIRWGYPDDDPMKRPITLVHEGDVFQTNAVEWL